MDYPKVSVVTITYGHEKYITETLYGVLMQQYGGAVEFIIANDNSHDHTDEIVKKYFAEHPVPDNFEIKYTRHETNKGMMANFIWALEQATGKYIALCEGDDYWTNQNKLQTQVSFLEENDEYGMVSTLRSNLVQTSGKITLPDTSLGFHFKSYSFEDILLGREEIATLTVMFRKNLFDELIILNRENPGRLSFLDYCLWLYFSYRMKVAILNVNTAVYRILESSASHGSLQKKIDLKKKYFGDFKFFKEKFGRDNINLFNLAEYHRAKFYYIWSSMIMDQNLSEELQYIFLKNKDYTRYLLLKIALNISFFKKLPYHVEGIRLLLTR